MSGFRYQLLVCVGVLALASLSAAQGKPQTFVGTITDSMCPKDHSQMQMGPTDADCVKACVAAHGATYVLADGKGNVYELSDQKTPEKFAAQKVSITGTLDPKTKKITVQKMSAAK